MSSPSRLAWIALVALAAAPIVASALDAPAASSDELRRRHAALAAEASSPFDIPLHLTSTQQEGTVRGDIYSRLDHRFDTVRETLREPQRWCEIMIVHPNVNGCRATGSGEGGSVELTLGRARHVIAFSFRSVQAADDFIDVRLDAPNGPAGTSDYRIRIEAAPLEDSQTLLHLAYSHGFGTQAKLATNAYFATFGRDKVGFSVTGRDAEGRPRLVRDLRGGLERNAMRYYLAIRSHLEVASLPPARRLDEGLRKFAAYTQRWPLQLGEGPDFVAVKQRDIARMRSGS